MADVAGAAQPLPRRLRLPASGVVLVALAALAWAATIAWANSRDMSAMPGTMGLGPPEFVAMWALMMSAMMLPSVWPFVAVYERTIRVHRVARLGALAGGYLLAWALVGVVAYGVAWVFGYALLGVDPSFDVQVLPGVRCPTLILHAKGDRANSGRGRAINGEPDAGGEVHRNRHDRSPSLL